MSDEVTFKKTNAYSSDDPVVDNVALAVLNLIQATRIPHPYTTSETEKAQKLLADAVANLMTDVVYKLEGKLR